MSTNAEELRRRNRERCKAADREDAYLLLQQSLEIELEDNGRLNHDGHVELVRANDGAIEFKVVQNPKNK